MFKLIVSSEDYLLQHRIEEIRQQMSATEDIEMVVVSNENITAEQLFEMLDFSPLFAASRLVVLHKLPLWDESGRRTQLLSQVKDGLLAYLQNPPTGQLVIATTNKVSAQNPLVGEFKRQAALEEIKAPGPGERQTLIKAEATRRGLAINDQELKLISESKQDLMFIMTMLDKWRLLPDIKINLAWLQQEGLMAGSEGAIFAFTDAIVLGNSKRALTELKNLQDEGEPSLKILATVNRQLMTLAKVKGWSEEGRPVQEIAGDIGDKKGFRTKRLIQDTQRLEWYRLRRLFGLIASTDIAIKTSKMPEEMAMEFLALQASNQI